MNFGFKAKPPKAPDQPHILIANCFQDQDFARKLAFALRRDKISPFIGVGEMTAGDSLLRRLSSATRPIDCIVPVISIASVTHNWVERDLPEVMTRETNQRRVRACPAKVDNCSLPAVLMGHFVADFHGLGWNPAYDAIKTAVLRRPGAEGPTFRQPVARPARPAPLVRDTAQALANTKQVYLSFDRDNDGYYRDVLETWSKMPGFADFWVNDRPPTVPVDSPEADPFKQALVSRIGAASGLLCVIGANSSTNGWMEWEIRKADELGKRIIAVRINRDCAVPELLSDLGATCAMSFTYEGIRRAIEEAYGETSLD